jgi:hypothetical protein
MVAKCAGKKNVIAINRFLTGGFDEQFDSSPWKLRTQTPAVGGLDARGRKQKGANFEKGPDDQP